MQPIEQLFPIDEDEHILDYRLTYNDFPIWLMFRTWFAWEILADERKEILSKRGKSEKEVNTKNEVKAHNWLVKKILKQQKIWKDRFADNKRYQICCKQNAQVSRNKKILYYTTNRHKIVDGVIHENVFDAYIRTFRDESVMYKSYDEDRMKYENACDVIFSDEYTYRFNHDSSYSRPTLGRQSDYDNISKLISVINNHLSEKLSQKFIVEITSSIINMPAQYNRERYEIDALLSDFPNIQVVIMSEGCYSYNSNAVYEFKKRGIPVIEIQHGVVSKRHVVYNWAPSLLESDELKAIQPDVLVQWSEFWNRSRVTCDIRYGANEEAPDLFVKKQVECDDRISLLLCAETSYENIAPFVEDAVNKFGQEVVLTVRFHPLYQDLADFCQNYIDNKQILVDTSPTVYDAIAQCDVMIVDDSTTFFDSWAVGTRAYVIDTKLRGEMFPDEYCVKSLAQLVEMEKSKSNEKVDAQIYKKRYYGDNLSERFTKIIEEVTI